MEQIVIAYKKIIEAARLLAAANERTVADEAKALAEQVDRSSITLALGTEGAPQPGGVSSVRGQGHWPSTTRAAMMALPRSDVTASTCGRCAFTIRVAGATDREAKHVQVAVGLLLAAEAPRRTTFA
jgi:hypothetical protein